jgi:HD-like signal output (HDOD) protein
LTAQQAFDASQLARLIESDLALAGEVMRVANSPALRPRAAVVSLRQAVSWLGIAEVRNIVMAVMLHGDVFVAPGHEPESEELWREAWLAGLWAKEIARERRKHVESAFLAALMHRTGAALALKILSSFEMEERTVMDARSFADLVVEFEPAFGRLLMNNWSLPGDVQDGATDWRDYRNSIHSDLAGTVHAAHLLATHTMYPQLLSEEIVLGDPVFEKLGVFPDDRRAMLAKRDHVRSLAGL